VPAVWDDSLLLEGSPDSHVVIARRSGTTWYIAGVSGLEENLELDLDTGFLGEGSHSLSMIVTGASPTELTERTGAVNAESGLRLTLAPKEGFVATLKRNA
jgi:hypothetical protein